MAHGRLARAARRGCCGAAGLPDRAASLLLYLGLGVLLGEDGIGIHFDDKELTRTLGYAALVVILAEGGLNTSWRAVRPAVPALPSWPPSGSGSRWRSPAGRAPTAGPAPGAPHCCWARSCPAPTPRQCSRCCAGCRCDPRLVGILEAESGFNDAPVVILVVALSGSQALDGGGIARTAGLLVAELGGGALIGLVVGCRRRGGSAGRVPRVRPLPDRGAGAGDVRLRRCGVGPYQRIPRRVPGGVGPGQRPAAARSGHPRVRRGPGLAGPDRVVRAARPAGHAVASWATGCCPRSASARCCCCWPGRSRWP